MKATQERKYYEINEAQARTAHSMMSMSDYEGGSKTRVENTEIMRLQIIFDGKPEPEVRTVLKKNGFKWAPSQGAWQRMLNTSAKYALNRVKEELEAAG